jgi:hypothetical protein
MKTFAELGKKQKSKAMKEAKLTRRKRASESGPLELTRQKAREKSYAHMKKHGG